MAMDSDMNSGCCIEGSTRVMNKQGKPLDSTMVTSVCQTSK